MDSAVGYWMIALFFVILIGLAALNAKINKTFTIEATWIAVALSPAIVWLLTTGQLSELTGFGLEVKLRRVAMEPVGSSYESLPIEPVAVATRPKGGSDTLTKMIESRTPGLKFELRKTGYYVEGVIREYLEDLTSHPFFRYALFVNRDGTFAGLMPGDSLLAFVVENPGSIVPMLEEGNIQSLPDVVTESVERGSSKRAALILFQSIQSPVLPVVDNRKVFVGVIQRERIIGDILVELAARI